MPASSEPLYQSDPQRLPDSHFQPGSLRLLVPGNVGRLLDARRTPVAIHALNPAEGSFELEIRAFEDLGAHWSVAFEDVGAYQFALDSQTADKTSVSLMEEAVHRLDRPLRIEADDADGRVSKERIRAERVVADSWLRENGPERVEPARWIAARTGDPLLTGLLESYLETRGLAAIDAAFAEAFVSNPNAGETVKGHAIVLARLGLCSYDGKVIRSPSLFAGDWSEERRANHLITRLAFTGALWDRAAHAEHPLYRAIASAWPLRESRPASFVSATFSEALALATSAAARTRARR